MGIQTDYFDKIGYVPKYELGERVFGYWNKIPFVGSVGNDRIISTDEGPRVTVTLDLPIKFEDKLVRVIIVKHKDIRRLVDFEIEDTKQKKKKK